MRLCRCVPAVPARCLPRGPAAKLWRLRSSGLAGASGLGRSRAHGAGPSCGAGGWAGVVGGCGKRQGDAEKGRHGEWRAGRKMGESAVPGMTSFCHRCFCQTLCNPLQGWRWRGTGNPGCAARPWATVWNAFGVEEPASVSEILAYVGENAGVHAPHRRRGEGKTRSTVATARVGNRWIAPARVPSSLGARL